MLNKRNMLVDFIFLIVITIILILSVHFFQIHKTREKEAMDNDSLEESISREKYQEITMDSIDGWYIGYSKNYAVKQTNGYADIGERESIVVVKMTHMEGNGEDHIRLQYLPIDNKRSKADLMDSVTREPYILIDSLYKFSNEIYTAKYQNSKNENSDNDAIIYSFDENEQQLLIRFEGLIDQTFSICYVPKETLNILISEKENELEQRLEELKVMDIQASENRLTQAAARFINQTGSPLDK